MNSTRRKPELTPEQIAAARAAHTAYMREWRKRNPTKNKEAIARYWARRAAQAEQDTQGI